MLQQNLHQEEQTAQRIEQAMPQLLQAAMQGEAAIQGGTSAQNGAMQDGAASQDGAEMQSQPAISEAVV